MSKPERSTNPPEYDSQKYSAQGYNVALPERTVTEVAAIMGISKRMVLHYEKQAFKKLRQRLGPRLDYGTFKISRRPRRKM